MSDLRLSPDSVSTALEDEDETMPPSAMQAQSLFTSRFMTAVESEELTTPITASAAAPGDGRVSVPSKRALPRE
jgi:hypothetical protein